MPKPLRGMIVCCLLLTLFTVGVTQPSFANPPAQDSRLRIVTSDETGLYNFVGIDSASVGSALPGATAIANGTPTAANALADISAYASQFGLSNPGQELQFMKASSFQGGSQSFRYQQVYQGVPVIAGEMIANYDPRGRLDALVGEVSPNLSINTTPRVTEADAATTALSYVSKATGIPTSQLTASQPALWIYDPRLLTPDRDPAALVWRIEVRSASGVLPVRYLILADAAFGGVRLGFNQIDTAWSGSQVNSKPAEAVVAQPSTNLALPIVNAPQRAPHYTDPTGRTYDSNHTTNLQFGAIICNGRPPSVLGSGGCTGPAAAAQYFAYQTFDYYDFHHNRDSINNAHLNLISNVNYCDFQQANCPGGYANAFWDGTQMVYGDYGFFTADDVVAHELTHGITEHSSGLFYWYESGAINESLSDIFGEFVDQWDGISSTGGTDSAATKWLMGEDVTGGAIRSMSNPPQFGDPDRTQSALYTKYDVFSVYFDRGGVHSNSGVGNKAAYLMAQGGTFNGYTIAALGNNKTSAIYYEVNTNLLSSGADYAMLGAAIVQACNNILAGANTIGMTAADCSNAQKATLATEMHLPPGGAAYSPQAELCPTNYQVEKMAFSDDMEGGLGAFSSGILVGGNGMPNSLAWVDSALNGPAPYAASGQHSAFGTNSPWPYGYTGFQVYESYFQKNTGVVLPAGSAYYLYFDHSFAFEPYPGKNFDGGVVEYELDNSGTWIDIGALYDAGQNYNGKIYVGYGNPLSGRNAFVQLSHGYTSTRYKLQSLAGHSVRFRWLIGADDVEYFYGWFLDNIQIYSCISTTAAPNRIYTTDTTPNLSWAPISTATKYEIQIADNAAFTVNATLYSNISKESLTFTVPAPLSLGTHYWRVRAYNGATPGNWSPTEAITIGS